jgi:hypothetical protein
MVDFPTRLNNTLVIFLTNRPSFIVNRCCPIPGVSDHDIVLIDPNVTPHRRKPTRLIYLWKRANVNEMKKELTE